MGKSLTTIPDRRSFMIETINVGFNNIQNDSSLAAISSLAQLLSLVFISQITDIMCGNKPERSWTNIVQDSNHQYFINLSHLTNYGV
jgi:hypothetical protein